MFKTPLLLVLLTCFCAFGAAAQDLKTTVTDNKELDSLRNKLENAGDSVVFTSKYVRFTTLRLTRDSIQTLPLDTSLRGFQNYSQLYQPRRPTINLGNLGLAARDMLFSPTKTIGFDPGFHALDYYAMTHDDVIYYQARSPFSNLYYVSGGQAEQVFKATHSQNIKPNWNFGANYNRIGANGLYARQRGDHLNGVFFTWYQSPSKRYNLWANAVFNTLKAQENGSVQNDNIFTSEENAFSREAENIRLSSARQLWRQKSYMLKQNYFVGRIDTLQQEITAKVLPTNKISHTLVYETKSFNFTKNEADDNTVLAPGILDANYTNDSTMVTHLQNEFIYSFFLRGKGSTIIKNELKLNVGLRNDIYNYEQFRANSQTETGVREYKTNVNNTTLLGSLGYRFSNRIDLNVDVQQIFQGRQIGDFLYEAKSNVLLSNNIGRIELGAYMQNKSPEQIYIQHIGNHDEWRNQSFDRTKIINLSFNYLNDRLRLEAGAQYYLVNDYLYFAPKSAEEALAIRPMQNPDAISLLKLTLGKKFVFGKFNFETYVVYQKTDQQNILRTPEVYTFNTFFFNQTFFKVLRTNLGFDVRYNTPFQSYSYSPSTSQFYLGNGGQLNTEPVVDVWLRASLRKANIFVKYDYANQGLFSKGFYTTSRYPMPDSMLKFGVSWNFYD
ncbi:putative porin [Pedobacter sp. SAFR-022]|uniref:putative porin n=1 Tax=Pedobacter sp. SAFR-022 TaxID=3436861 RepID=UPI003F7FC172